MCCIDHGKTPDSAADGKLAIRSTSAAFKLECRWCGWGDHNSTFHERMVEQQAEKP